MENINISNIDLSGAVSGGGSGSDVTKSYVDTQDRKVENKIPTKTSQLDNDSDWIPASVVYGTFSVLNTVTEYVPQADGETVTVESSSLTVVDTSSVTSFTVQPSYIGTGEECVVQFDGKDGLSVSFPADLKWADGQAPVIGAGKTYQVSMQNGTACWKAFSAAV